jgi:hypothetical protein
MMDTVDMITHPVVRQKSDFQGNSDFQNSQKLDLLQISAKNVRPEYASLSKIFCYNKLTRGALYK